MERKFKYKYDRRSKRITLAVSSLVLLGFVLLFFVTGGSYLPVWIFVVVVVVIALYILSIPLYIKINDDTFEIHCIVDLTKIDIEDIETIKHIERHDLKPFIPLLGSYGFFGYYGYYLNLWEWDVYKIYASQRKNLVVIEDIYEDKYVVSCNDRDKLIELTIEARNKKRSAGALPQGQ